MLKRIIAIFFLFSVLVVLSYVYSLKTHTVMPDALIVGLADKQIVLSSNALTLSGCGNIQIDTVTSESESDIYIKVLGYKKRHSFFFNSACAMPEPVPEAIARFDIKDEWFNDDKTTATIHFGLQGLENVYTLEKELLEPPLERITLAPVEVNNVEMAYASISEHFNYSEHKKFVLEEAVSKSDWRRCSDIKDRYEYVQKDLNDFTNSNSYVDDCITSVAIATHDLNICHQFRNGFADIDCQREVIEDIGDIDMCKKIWRSDYEKAVANERMSCERNIIYKQSNL